MAHFQMSTSGSKSNEHVAHFLVDIHMVSRSYNLLTTLEFQRIFAETQ